MSTVDIEDLLPKVRAEVSQAPTQLAIEELRKIIRDFCQITRAWQYEVEQETILALVSDYDIELPSTDAYPISIEFMSNDGAEVFFKDAAWLDRYITNWRLREADDFRYFTQLTTKQFTFPCVPQNNGTIGGLYYRVSLKPNEDATTVDQDLRDEWVEAWIDGAKGALMNMSGKAWTDQKRGDALEAKYRHARSNARIRVARSWGNANQRWVGPRFAGR